MKLLLAALVVYSSAFANYPDPGPAGFEDPALLAKVMGGEIVVKDLVDTKTEFRTVAKAYFNRVTPEAYWQLSSNFVHYPKMFSEVKEGKALEVSVDKLAVDWWLHLKIKVGFISQDFYPEGSQEFLPGLHATSEARVANRITNLQEYLKSGKQTTRLIPFDNGILVEDDIHAVLQDGVTGSALVKKELRKFFLKYISTFRKELQG